MAGLIKALFGGRQRPPDPNPLPGIGGYQQGPGPAGQTGFPGSTGATRTLRGRNPRQALIRSDTNGGWESGLGTTANVQQSAYRGDVPGAAVGGPRTTGSVRTPQGRIRQTLQTNSDAEFFGGPMLRTGPGNNTAGANPLHEASEAGGHSVRATETVESRRDSIISGGVPGSNNVRNEIAQRYKAIPGMMRAYRSASRGDQAPVLLNGQAADGNVKPELATTEVMVPSRFVYAGGGVSTYSMLRQMPYTGRGNGARGAALNGERYYATGQDDQFFNAGMGDYGIERQRGQGHKRPVSFTMPAPWTTNFYDTTESVGTTESPGVPTQAPNLVYVSPSAGRASNTTGRLR